MPLFDFYCPRCETTKEYILHFHDADIPIFCPKCSMELKKQFPDTFNFILKYDPRKDKVSWGAEGYAETQRYKEVKKKHPKKFF